MQRDFNWRDWVSLLGLVGFSLIGLLWVVTGLLVVGFLSLASGEVGVLFAAWSARKEAGDG